MCFSHVAISGSLGTDYRQSRESTHTYIHLMNEVARVQFRELEEISSAQTEIQLRRKTIGGGVTRRGRWVGQGSGIAPTHMCREQETHDMSHIVQIGQRVSTTDTEAQHCHIDGGGEKYLLLIGSCFIFLERLILKNSR